jgi:hypothetical protein
VLTVDGPGRGVAVAAALLLAVLAAGCHKVTGGGWVMSSANPLEKATFGFTAKCRDTTVDSTPVAVAYDGQLEYHDPSVGIRIHGDVEPQEFIEAFGLTCKEVGELLVLQPSTTFEGTYRSQPGGEQGHFVVVVTDNGQPGRNGDMFCITLTGEIAHENCKPVQGGNIQIQ